MRKENKIIKCDIAKLFMYETTVSRSEQEVATSYVKAWCVMKDTLPALFLKNELCHKNVNIFTSK